MEQLKHNTESRQPLPKNTAHHGAPGESQSFPFTDLSPELHTHVARFVPLRELQALNVC